MFQKSMIPFIIPDNENGMRPKLIPFEYGLYAILTDPVIGYEKLTEILIEHQVAFIQLRIKNQSRSCIKAIATTIRSLTRGTSSRFIINDDPTLAAQVNADGVHIGQNDISFEQTRAIAGPSAIIGISTHNPRQTIDACATGADYIGIGPVFLTPTKKNPDPVIGLDGMKTMLNKATISAVCIGGIDLSNLKQVLQSGARNFCMVRCINQSEAPRMVLSAIDQIIQEHRNQTV